MRSILDALSMSVVLTVVPWILIQIGVGAALAWRLGLEPWVGAALGLIPIPCAGWAIVAIMGHDGLIATDDERMPLVGGKSSKPTPDDGW